MQVNECPIHVADGVVVVTGGARGIGRALARRFAAAKAKVVVVADVDEAGANAVAGEITGMAVRCDVSNESDVEQLVRRVQTEH